MGRKVPDVLLSGNHGLVDKWRRERSIERTLKKRPELLEGANLTDKEREYVEKLKGNTF
jgi:tRNA (guanine37-N1)-methyltransferase